MMAGKNYTHAHDGGLYGGSGPDKKTTIVVSQMGNARQSKAEHSSAKPSKS